MWYSLICNALRKPVSEENPLVLTARGDADTENSYVILSLLEARALLHVLGYDSEKAIQSRIQIEYVPERQIWRVARMISHEVTGADVVADQMYDLFSRAQGNAAMAAADLDQIGTANA